VICTPAPGSAQAAGVALRPALWVARRVGVRFLGGETWQRVTVAFTVRAGWNQASALQFVFDDAPDAPVRVTFEPGTSWCMPGSAALGAPPHRPTMNLGFTQQTSVRETTRLILHEFGHALGLMHEHQHPGVLIPWDLPALYAHYARVSGWTPEMVDAQVVRPLAAEVAACTAYDAQSIMAYALPAELLTDASWAHAGNAELSAGDRATVEELYGPLPAGEAARMFLPIVRK